MGDQSGLLSSPNRNPTVCAQTIESSSASDETEIVGLELVCRHVHFVALTMVDENVPHAPITEHLKILGVLVDVKNDLERLLRNKLFKFRNAPQIHRRHRSFIPERKHRARRASDDAHRKTLRQLRKRRIPLTDLIKVDLGISEVHNNADCSGRRQRMLTHEIRDATPIAARTQHCAHHLACGREIFP
ncbi:hypothetical protein [Salinibacterium sp. PAMC 21357]|uniref:hypothetical protein n=1 Tax=Salinibacterium sp. PAMC 21357 TaxID=1112215 RepID=UPI00307B067C